jgi:hypothetical protein
LHYQYAEELRRAADEVQMWWDALVADTVETTGSRVAAAAVLERRWPAGPSAHPRVLAVIIKYYLACEALNERLRAEQRSAPQRLPAFTREDVDESLDLENEEYDAPVPPGVFVGEMLASKDTRDLARIVAQLKYWPVGVDDTGQFV